MEAYALMIDVLNLFQRPMCRKYRWNFLYQLPWSLPARFAPRPSPFTIGRPDWVL